MDLHYLDDHPGRTARINGREHLFFSGYNYLGVSEDPEFRELIIEGASRFGWLFPSSRISNTRLKIYEECEALLSAVTGSEDTVLTTSGYMAGRMALSGRAVINAPGSHPAILASSPEHRSYREWTEWLVSGLHAGTISGTIATDSLSPLTATINDFTFLNDIGREVELILDDSHGIGIIGRGKGIAALVPRAPHLRYTFTYSLSKAFGVAGGAVSCSAAEAARLRELPAYTAVTPQSPAQLFAFARAGQIYARQLKRLRMNMAILSQAVSHLPGITGHPDFPVFILGEHYSAEDLFRRGIIISSFAYPDPKGKKLNRVVLNALHTEADLGRLSNALHEVCYVR